MRPALRKGKIIKCWLGKVFALIEDYKWNCTDIRHWGQSIGLAINYDCRRAILTQKIVYVLIARDITKKILMPSDTRITFSYAKHFNVGKSINLAFYDINTVWVCGMLCISFNVNLNGDDFVYRLIYARHRLLGFFFCSPG